MVKKYCMFFLCGLIVPFGLYAMQLSDLDEDSPLRAHSLIYFAQGNSHDKDKGNTPSIAFEVEPARNNDDESIEKEEIINKDNEHSALAVVRIPHDLASEASQEPIQHIQPIVSLSAALADQKPIKKTVPCLKFFAAQSLVNAENVVRVSHDLPVEVNTYSTLCKLAQKSNQPLCKKYVNSGKVSKKLLNANFDSLKKHGFNPIFVALNNNDLQSLQALLADERININSKDGYGFTPLITAVNTGSDYYVELMLERSDLDVNATDDFGYSALTHASQKGFDSIISLLMGNKNINILHKDNAHRSPFDHAIERNEESALSSLIKNSFTRIARNVQNNLDCNKLLEKYELIVKPK